LLWSRVCGDEDLVLHLVGKTSQTDARGKNLGTAIPIHQQRDGVSVKFRPGQNSTTAPEVVQVFSGQKLFKRRFRVVS